MKFSGRDVAYRRITFQIVCRKISMSIYISIIYLLKTNKKIKIKRFSFIANYMNYDTYAMYVNA